MSTIQVNGEIVLVSKEKVRFGKTRTFITIADVSGKRHVVKISQDQIREFDLEDFLSVGRKVHAEIETFKKGEEYVLPDGKKVKYEGDGRKLLSMTALSSFELRSISATQSLQTLSGIEEPDLRGSMATVLAGIR